VLCRDDLVDIETLWPAFYSSTSQLLNS